MRVGDAFQAIVGLNLVAIWDCGFVSKFLKRGIAVSFASNKRDAHQPTASAEGEVRERVTTDGLRYAA